MRKTGLMGRDFCIQIWSSSSLHITFLYVRTWFPLMVFLRGLMFLLPPSLVLLAFDTHVYTYESTLDDTQKASRRVA